MSPAEQPVAGASRPPAQAVDSDDDDDDFMPALPPSLAPAPSTSKGAIGPSLPPGFRRSETPPPLPRAASAEAESSDEEAGPMPLPAGLQAASGEAENEGVRMIREREERAAAKEKAEKDAKPKREAWMLLPPTGDELLSNINPTKLQKARGFRQTAKPHASSNERSSGPSELWTETPEERAKRMEDEVLGKRRRVENATEADDEKARSKEGEERRRRQRDDEMRRRVEEHNKANRGGDTLFDLHHQARTAIESAKSSSQKDKERKEAVIWDRETMMGSGGKLIGEKDRAKMVKNAQALGGRFGGGSFL